MPFLLLAINFIDDTIVYKPKHVIENLATSLKGTLLEKTEIIEPKKIYDKQHIKSQNKKLALLGL